MHVLFVVPYVPSLIRVRPFNLIRHLTARGNKVTVLTIWTDEQERADASLLGTYAHAIETVHLPTWRSYWNCLLSLPRSVPLQAMYSWSNELSHRVAELSPGADIVHVEHLRGARYALRSQRSTTSSQVPIVWDSVDCISYLFEQAVDHSRSRFGRLATRVELPRTRRYEGWLTTAFERVLVTSPIDKEQLIRLHRSSSRQRSPRKEAIYGLASSTHRRFPAITVLPNGVDLGYFTPPDEPRDSETLVFSGKMSYHANITAVLRLVNEVMPLIWERRPHVRLTIVGKDPPRQVQQLELRHEPRVTVTGTVPDLRPYLRRATVAVFPIVYGAGCQNKVLEAMACRTPVVTTPQGISALQVKPNRDLLVAEDVGEIARLVMLLLEDAQERERIGQAARDFVETHHSWSTVAEQLEKIYREVVDAER